MKIFYIRADIKKSVSTQITFSIKIKRFQDITSNFKYSDKFVFKIDMSGNNFLI